MRTVNIAELKNKLSAYLTFAKAGEEVIIRDRNKPIAKLVPYLPDGLSKDDLELVALGHMRLPEKPFDIEEFKRMPRPKVSGNAATQAILDERAEDER
jgi:prevent-host-death family protein